MTQTEKIKKYLDTYGSITSLDAMREFGIMRLASRMSDLKRQGYKFKVVTECGKNRFQETIHYARYIKEQ